MTACHESKIQFKCSRCSMKFYTKNALASHLGGISETNGVAHACNSCDFKSCRLAGLKIHVKRAHLNSSTDYLNTSVKIEKNIDVVNDGDGEKDATLDRKENSGNISDESVFFDDSKHRVVAKAKTDAEEKDLPDELQMQSENPEVSDDVSK